MSPVQVLVDDSVRAVEGAYGGLAIICAICALLLPVETRRRGMQVCSVLVCHEALDDLNWLTNDLYRKGCFTVLLIMIRFRKNNSTMTSENIRPIVSVVL